MVSGFIILSLIQDQPAVVLKKILKGVKDIGLIVHRQNALVI